METETAMEAKMEKNPETKTAQATKKGPSWMRDGLRLQGGRPYGRLSDVHGFAMASMMLAILILVVFSSFSVRQTALDQRSSSHVDTGNRALFAAESGAMHALNRINAVGVVDFESDIIGRWAEIFGESPRSIGANPAASYEVTVTADATAPADRGTLTVTGRAPLLARRTLRIGLAKGAFRGAPGAIHIAAPPGVQASFKGNAFEIDGNDHDRFGNLVGGIVKPGISARDPAAVDSIRNSLGHQQADNVRGAGFDSSTGTPSVMRANAPDMAALDQLVANLLTRPGVMTTNDRDLNGNDTFGTLDFPQITYMTQADVKLNGNAQGAGILIVDGSITINGSLDFTGLVIVRGATTINAAASSNDDTVLLGSATILGSLWTANLYLDVGGSAIANYCQECLWLVDHTGNTAGSIPRSMRIVSWSDQ